ncbi:TetR/AcrR family transcriptional regulator [Cryptosporangium sp. NPDC048952]|uniref:TetR/AcrR family transcriptional regulator n=1 Tax=Cryptosporangium sp. NPDC048952 TaxID=3363961 RepID=UPI00370FFD33
MPYHHGQLRPALLAVAERTLREQGEEQLSLRELAREIGVSHAAPRRHFPDRQALLDALAEAGFARLHGELQAALDGATPGFLPRMHAAAAAFIRFATGNAALLRLMFAGKHGPGAEQVERAAAPMLALIYGVIAEGQTAGALPAGAPEQVGLVLFATLQGIAVLANGEMVPAGAVDGLVETAVEQFVRGAGG